MQLGMVSEDQSEPRVFAPQAVNAVRLITASNLSLSQMADQKASILMGANFLVFTITVGFAGRGHAPTALLVLGGFAFVSACLAVAVVMPSVMGRHVPSVHPNMMFFSIIARMDEDAYVEAVLDNLVTDEAMYRMILHDIWQNAQVLARKKYRMLGWAYRCFLAGLVVSASVFAMMQFA